MTPNRPSSRSPVPVTVLSLPHRRGNPRNSEGAFIDPADGRILFAYTKSIGKAWSDHASAVIAERISSDGGRI